MEEIQKRLSKLTNEELRAELKSSGEKTIPITKTTRTLVERRIAKYLWEKEGGGEKKGSEKGPSDVSHEDLVDGVSRKKAEEPNPTASTQDGVNSLADVDAVFISERNSQMKVAPVITNFFVICIPPKSETSSAGTDSVDSSSASGSSDEILIYHDRKEALNIAKKNKGARFKVFKTKEEAETFAKSHQDLSTPKPATEPVSNQAITEKAVSNFRSVKPQDLVVLRKTIEQSCQSRFKEMVWGNPRYLLNAGDTPTILQEGSRYNAMHIIAKDNLADMCTLLLETLENPDFILLMYPDDPDETLISRKEYLVDLYLNSPDKVVGETPLHFASKFGHVEVAELLVNHPQCIKTLKNKDGQTASDIVCSRCKASGEALKQQKKVIQDLLNDHYYVPLLRSEDNCTQPIIGEPWSPDLPELQSSSLVSRPESPLDSVMSLQAYAGPMSPSEAECFRRTLQTPPSTERKRVGRIKRTDSEKGLERIGRELAGKMHVSWAEYWSFLDAFVDITSPQGLEKFEEYLERRCSTTDKEKAEVTMQVPAVKLEDDFASSQTDDGLMKNLVGDFERLLIGSTEEGGNVSDSAHEKGTSVSINTQKNKIEMSTKPKRAALSENQNTECEQEERSITSSVSGSCPTSNDSSEKATVDIGKESGVNCNETNGKTEEASTEKHTEELKLGERTVIPNQIDSSEWENVKCQPGDNMDRMKLTSTCPNQRENNGDVEVIHLNESAVDAVTVLGHSKLESNSPPGNESTDPKSNQDDTTEVRSEVACTPCSLSDDRSTMVSMAIQKSSSITDVQCTTEGVCTPNRTAKKDSASSTSGQQRDVEESMSHLGNGDGRGEIFSTPKMNLSRKSDCSLRGGGKVGFIVGSQPTKTDLHVWRALAEVKIPDGYPCIQRWKQLVSSVPGETRDSWPTPARCPSSRMALTRPFQTPSPHHLHGFNSRLSGSPLSFRARHFSEPIHRSREPRSLHLQQARFDVADTLGGLKARLFQE